MFTLPFNFNGNEYTALVHEKYMTMGKEYRITIMNGELETLLYGDHIISELDGMFITKNTTVEEKQKLLSSVKSALTEHLMAGQVY
jgi:hypothetical protein